ncbi:AMP-binding protein [Paracoccaceae bacterium]|nr:AMP-binding protein [Paracoccaceae bacterium]
MIDKTHFDILNVIETHGTYQPEKLAICCEGVNRQWRDLKENINKVANFFKKMGVEKGDNIALLIGNRPEIIELIFGIVKMGACVVPLSGLLTKEQVTVLVNNSDAKLLIADHDFVNLVTSDLSQFNNIGEDKLLFLGGDSDCWEKIAFEKKEYSFEYNCAPEDNFNIIYSSGTTGIPKGIVQTHRARSHWATSNAIEMSFNSESKSLTTTALYSNGTWLMMLPTLFVGGTLHVMNGFDANAFVDLVKREQITHTFLVPPQFSAILSLENLQNSWFGSLKTILSAGSPLRLDIKENVLSRISENLFELYGFSEGFATMLKPYDQKKKFGSVGTPVLGFEIKIIDEKGKECSPNVAGEIVGYGAGMMKEYYSEQELTNDLIWTDQRGRSFIKSGDIGSLDEDGYLSILDRKKDMIISGGLNVFPVDIEEVVSKHPEIIDVTVIGVPHEKWGETCLALIIPRHGIEIDCDEVKRWCNEKLAKHQRLHNVEIREEFPRNALGKVLKRILREPYWD